MSSNDSSAGPQTERLPKLWAALFLLTGIFSGLFTHLSIEHIDDVALSFALSQGFLLGPLLFVLGVRSGKVLATAVFASVAVLCLGLLASTSIYRFGLELSENAGLLFLLAGQAIIFTYILLPFFQTWLDDGDFSFSYERLFVHSWNNGLLALVGLTFMWLFWLILFLFALLFQTVGIEAMIQLLSEPLFDVPAKAGATALGIFIARDHSRIVAALRGILFSLLSVLNPVFLILAVGFLIALSVGGFEKLSDVVSASATILSLITIGVVLSNAVFRDGSDALAANRWLRIATMALLPVLLCFVGFAYYAIHLRISDYGLTPDRIWIAVGTGILALYAIAYIVSLLFRDHWMSFCRRANVYIALIVATIALAMQTPFADPFVLSAKSQYERLVSGTADAETFDYGFLKFGLGAPGREALERIREDSGVAERDIVVAQLDLLAETQHESQWRQQVHDSASQSQSSVLGDPDRMTLVPSDLQLPEDLLVANLPNLNSTLRRCGEAGDLNCIVSTLDLTDSPGDEVIFATRDSGEYISIYILEQKLEGWRSLNLVYSVTGSVLWEDLKSGKLSAVPANFRDLKVGDQVIRYRE